MALMTLSGTLPPSFCAIIFLMVASRRGVGFFGICSYCDVIEWVPNTR